MESWIVIVDDEEMSLTNARVLLGSENMRVSCLRSGKDLLKFIKKNSPDLVLLDIMMPEMDGFETYHALREYEEQSGLPNIPVIFLTGENDAAVEQEGLSIGASDFIRKPFNKEIVVRRIENTIRNNKTIESLTEEAMVDKLTGFLNKDRGTEITAKLCNRKTGTLMVLDLDNFKLVNDLFGHDYGDRVLKALAEIIRTNTRETDTVTRIGGDEFMVFCEDMTEEWVVAALSLRLNKRLSEKAVELLGENNGIPLGLSIGAVMVPDEGRDFNELFTHADSALYMVKNNGKHSYSLYRTGQDTDTHDDLMPEQRLERIIKIVEERNDSGGALMLGNDSFSLVYRFVMRFYKRYGGTAALLLFTVTPAEGLDNIELTEACENFGSILKKVLRMSDIIMQSGSDSFFIMLTERDRAEAECAAERVMRAWKEVNYSKDITVSYVFKYVEHQGESFAKG